MNDTELKLAKAIGTAIRARSGDYSTKYHWAEDGVIDHKARYGDPGRYGVEVKISACQKYALPSDEDGTKAVVEISSMYGGIELTMDLLETIAEVSGSRKINIGDNEQVGSGCDTCGHNGRYVLTVTILDPKVA